MTLYSGQELSAAPLAGISQKWDISLDRRDVELVAQRLKLAREDYEEQYGKPKK